MWVYLFIINADGQMVNKNKNEHNLYLILFGIIEIPSIGHISIKYYEYISNTKTHTIKY